MIGTCSNWEMCICKRNHFINCGYHFGTHFASVSPEARCPRQTRPVGPHLSLPALWAPPFEASALWRSFPTWPETHPSRQSWLCPL